MSPLRLFGLSSLLVAALAPATFAADNSTRLLRCVPAGTPFVMHVRSIADLKAEFARSPYARLWTEPEVQAFFAPALAFLDSPDAQEFFGKFEDATGLSMGEFLALFSGETVLSVTMTVDAAGEPKPEVALGRGLGANRASFEDVLTRVSERVEAESGGTLVREELQGEMIFTFFAKPKHGKAPEETISWAIVDDAIWVGYPKAAVQGMVANLKSDGASEPITTAAGFAPIYGRNPGAQGVYYLDIESIVRIGMGAYQASEAAKQLKAAEAKGDESEAEEPKPPTMFEQMGLTPEVIIHALGVDAMRSVYMVSLGGESMAVEAGLTWTEQRGLLKMFAFGAAPAPQPAFVPANWPEVSTMRYQPAGFWESIKDCARTANPMFEFMLAQQLAAVKQQTGIDVEQDFFGAFGDEAVIARSFLDDVSAGLNGTEQLWSMSLVNAESLTRVVDTILAMVPNGAQMFEERDYLGHKIRSISAPFPGMGASQTMSLSFAITPSHLFIDLGGSGMIEAAVQRLDADGTAFWASPAVIAGLQSLPGGSVGIGYQDAGQAIHQAFEQIANLARMSAASAAAANAERDTGVDENGRPVTRRRTVKSSGPGLHMFIDPDSVPSRETVARHLGTTVSGIYLDADGIRMHAEYKHVP